MPDEVRLKGSCRAISEDTRQILENRVMDICKGLAQTYEIDITCDYQQGYPVLINHPKQTHLVTQALNSIVGQDNVMTKFDPIMGSEDFAFFLQKIPGCYFGLGNGEDSRPIHTSDYNFNDDASKYGIAAFTKIVELELGA